ncbi:MAG: hypothetical protein LBR71_06540 [Synergistaceae bacterium]|jgi:hypothetical protein|nr:hypothetical protein [Synergistaceae bacterium]
MTQTELTNDKMRDILCAPLATDSIEDIDFDDPGEDFDPDADMQFIEGYIRKWMKSRNAEA